MILRHLLPLLDRLLPDPQPSVVLEIGSSHVLGARRRGGSVRARARRRLPDEGFDDGTNAVPAGLEDAVTGILKDLGPVPDPHTALLLPDSVARLSLLQFESLPARRRDLGNAVLDRLRRSLPFSAKMARIAYRVQGADGSGGPSILAESAPVTYVQQCEEVLERAGLLPGFVGSASAAALNLLENTSTTLLLRLARSAMTLIAVEDGSVLLLRRVALAAGPGVRREVAVGEVAADLLPTLAYLRENLGKPASSVRVCGPAALASPVLEALHERLPERLLPLVPDRELPSVCDTGLLGYVHG